MSEAVFSGASSDAWAELGGLPPIPPAPPLLTAEEALWLAMLLQALNRVVTEPGSGDRAFLRDLRGKHPDCLTERQRAHVMRLAWRYRHQIKPALRPGRDPDQEAKCSRNCM